MLDQPLPVVVRPSTEQDVPHMVDIYAFHVQNGLGDYQPEPLHAEDVKRRRKAMLKRRLPHIVADLNGAIIGYAYAVPFLKRPAYRYAVKHSIYVREDHRQSGVGRKLLPALIEACAAAGYRQMVCYVDGSNAASLSLHELFGFERAGVLKSVAFRFAGGPTRCSCSARSARATPPRRAGSKTLSRKRRRQSRIDAALSLYLLRRPTSVESFSPMPALADPIFRETVLDRNREVVTNKIRDHPSHRDVPCL